MAKAKSIADRLSGNIRESMGEGKGGGMAHAPARREAPAREQGVSLATDVMDIEVGRIIPDPDQPRKTFDADKLRRLADSMLKRGQLQQISVRWSESEAKYIIVAGERRWRAANMAGLATLKAVDRSAKTDGGDRLADQLVENLLRDDLAGVEQARAFSTLMDLNGWSESELARELDVSPSTVTRSMALITGLTETVRDRVEAGEIGVSAAYEVSKLSDPALQEEVADRVVGEGLTRDQTADAVREAAPRDTAPRERQPGKMGAGRGVRARKGGDPKARTEWKHRSKETRIAVVAQHPKAIDARALLATLEEFTTMVRASIAG